MGERLPIIGRDLQIIDAFAKKLHAAARVEGDYTELGNTSDLRGLRFQVKLADGRVATVTVELDRVEQTHRG